jgi:Helix-turn-helix domain
LHLFIFPNNGIHIRLSGINRGFFVSQIQLQATGCRVAWTINESCDAFRISRSSVYKMIGQGKLRTAVIGGRRLIPGSEGERLLESAPRNVADSGKLFRPHKGIRKKRGSLPPRYCGGERSMTFQNETRRVDDAAGPVDVIALAATDITENRLPPPKIQQPSPAAQEAIADLHRDFIGECLRIAAINAAQGADNIWLADDLNAERDIRLAVENIREAARSFREWQARDARHG